MIECSLSREEDLNDLQLAINTEYGIEKPALSSHSMQSRETAKLKIARSKELDKDFTSGFPSWRTLS
jgi:hypothetical protein